MGGALSAPRPVSQPPGLLPALTASAKGPVLGEAPIAFNFHPATSGHLAEAASQRRPWVGSLAFIGQRETLRPPQGAALPPPPRPCRSIDLLQGLVEGTTH